LSFSDFFYNFKRLLTIENNRAISGTDEVDFYTHDQPIKNISYKNNVVWAFSSEKIIKRYLQ
jgi:hypothetical protein